MKTVAAIPAIPGASDFTAYAKFLLLSRGNVSTALSLAENTHGTSERVVRVLKAAVAAGTTTNVTWATELIDHEIIVGGFLEALRNDGIFDRLLAGGMRQVPLKAGRIVVNSTLLVAGKVGEGAPKPISALSLGDSDLEPEKVSAIIVLSNELAKAAGSSGMKFLSSELRAAVVAGSDKIFLDALAAAAVPVTGSADVGADIAALLAAVGFGSTSQLYLIVSPVLAAGLAAAHAATGFLYPSMTPMGGALAGITTLVSDQMADDQALMIDASRIAGATGPVVLDSASHATLQMDSAPDNPQTAATVMTSLWPNNLLGLRCERYLSFLPIGTAAALADGVTWTA